MSGVAIDPYLLDWANLLLRWAHVVTVIAWIGSSFYFVFLDSSLVGYCPRRRPGRFASRMQSPMKARASSSDVSLDNRTIVAAE